MKLSWAALLVFFIAMSSVTSQISKKPFEQKSEDMLKSFMLTVMRASYGFNFTCDQCQKVEKEATQLISTVLLNWKPLMGTVCKILSQKSQLTEAGCNVLMSKYVPIVEKTFTRLFILNTGLVCSFALEKCADSTIKRLDISPILDQIYEGMPPKKEKTPTLKSTYKILQINDIHIDLQYSPGGIINCKDGLVCCRANKTAIGEPQLAGHWGSPRGSCDLPKSTFERFIEIAKEIKPDFIMWLGDNEAHEIDTVDESINLETTTYLSGLLSHLAGHSRFIVSIGNHENIPVDNMDFNDEKKNQWFFKNLTSAYSKLLTQDEQSQISKNGYYTTYFKERNLRVMSLFSAPNDGLNFYNLVRTYDQKGMITWMWKTLKAAEQNNEDVYITIHIPFGNDFSISLFDELTSALVDRFSNNIRAVFSAHTHNDHLTFFGARDDREKVIKTQFISPSMTTWTNLHPSYRIYEVDTDTNEIVDYTQYRLDLDKYNTIGEKATLEWDKVYSFKDLYKVPDLGTTSMQSFKDTFWKDWTTMGPYMYNFHTLTYKKGDIVDRKEAIRLRCALYSKSRDVLNCIGILTPFIAMDILPTLILSNLFPAFMKFN